MTAAYRVVVAERKDVAVVTIVCPECGAEVSIAIATARVPDSCPSCEMGYTLPVKDALAALGRFHRSAATAEEHAEKLIFRFQIKQID